MDVAEPRVRRRGLFFHAETPDPDHVEYEAAEGIAIRPGSTRKPTHAIRTTSLSPSREVNHKGRSVGPIRSANGTDSHRQARMSR
jgi:hypothetical protein